MYLAAQSPEKNTADGVSLVLVKMESSGLIISNSIR
jgi:hypothetical protein